ncbi:MAG TPA: peptidylprolyl isomerase [Bacillota bacterium]|nr:peptidylprolyl isomerase [Bacillota bacterium]
MLPRRQLMLLASLMIILAGSLIICGWKTGTRKHTEPHRFGLKALKVNGSYVDPAVFHQEQKRFYSLWKRNGRMLRLSDEERNDLLLEEVINRVTLEEYLRRQKQAQLEPGEVEQYIKRYIKTEYPTAEAMQHYLESIFCENESDLKHQVAVYLMQLKCFPAIAQQYGIAVSTTDVEEREHRQTEGSQKVVIRHILIAPLNRTAPEAEKLALDLYRQLSEGTDFATLVKQFSDDGQTRENGGQLGPLTRAQLPPEFASQIFNAQPGKLLPAVKTQYGWEIIKVEQFINSAHPRAELRAMLAMEKFLQSKEYDNWLTRIKKDTKIEITEPCLLAYRYAKRQKYQQAGQLYEKSYEQYQVEFYLNRSIVNYRSAHNWSKVVELSQIGIHNYARQVPYYLYAAEGLHNRGKKREAEKLLVQAEQLATGNVVYQEMISQTYSNLGLKHPGQ